MRTPSRTTKVPPAARRGQVLPVVGLSTVVLIGFAALAADVGYLRYAERVQQSATDSAALAGAGELAYSPTNVSTSAKSNAATNGFTDDGANVIVTVRNPPSAGSYSSDPKSVEVVVRKKQPLFLQQTFGSQQQWIETRGVGRLINTPLYCMYALKTTPNPVAPSGKNATASFNTGTISMPNCGIISNGGMYFESLSRVDALSIGSVGTAVNNGSNFTRARPAQALSVTDPCKTIPSCRNLTNAPPATSPCQTFDENVTVHDPGIYCGMSMLNNNGAHTFHPGLYVIAGDLKNNGVPMQGNDVTFYQASGKININSSASVGLNAPTTGQYAGMLFFQPASNTNQAYFESSNSGNGMLYFPNAPLSFNSNTTTWSPIVAGWLYMEQWSAVLPSNFTSVTAQHAVLAE
jgi:hypothetical protein